MKEIPILLSTPMVQATIAGNKTKTRRTRGLDKINENPNDWFLDKVQLMGSFIFHNKINKQEFWVKCPYGKVGDLLWIREKHRSLFNCQTGEFHSYNYYAEMPEEFHLQQKIKYPKIKWKPSIHMPKAAARIWLYVINTKLERLKDITEKDAIDEGIQSTINNDGYLSYSVDGAAFYGETKAIRSFRTLWIKLNGLDSWNVNPWVWVIKFEVLSITGKPNLLQTK